MSYGATTDPWSFADTTMHLQSYEVNPAPGGEAQAQDSNGDVAASTMYDTANSTVSATYKSCRDAALVLYDTTAGVDFRLGKVIGGNVITKIDVSTSNTDGRPTIVIGGEHAHGIADSAMPKYDPSDLEIAMTRKATAIGVTVDTVTNLLSSSGSASVSVSKTPDSNGNTACMDVYGGRVEASNELVGVTGAAGAAAADTNWTVSAGPSNAQTNTAYATGSITVFKNLTAM